MAQKLLKAYYAEKEKTRRRLEKEMRRNDYLIHKKLCKRRKLCIECNSSLEKNKSPNESLCDGCYTKRKEYKQRKKRMRRKKLKRKYPYIGTEQECFSCGNRFKVKGKNSTACSEKCRRRMRMVELMRERGTYPKVPCPKCGLKFASEKGVKCHERKMHKDGGE